MHWSDAVNSSLACIVKIETPTGHGTGFLCFDTPKKSMVAIATAGHVIFHADKWMEPIRIYTHDGSKSLLLKANERHITMGNLTDSALILFSKAQTLFEKTDPLPLLDQEYVLRVGTQVGWIGFPTLEPDTPCFFAGMISARKDTAYLIDGVAINGVSGGPVLYIDEQEQTRVVGTVSAYRINKTTGDTLPGLLIAQDLSLFHDVLTHIRTVAENLSLSKG
ncbi:MAG: serine protease [Proteobacteria bacterium]|nr:serine protease [Pseudomonadota bacterium]